jgi:hypothetical protein
MNDTSGPLLTFVRNTDTTLDPVKSGFVAAVNRSLLLAASAAGLAPLLLVEAHGGQVRVESTSGAGASFSFTLPIVSGSW